MLRVRCVSSQTSTGRWRCERIHEEPGGEEHADGQQDDGEVGEHSRVHRAGVSGHCLQFLQRSQRGTHELIKRLNEHWCVFFDIAAQCVLCLFKRQMPLKQSVGAEPEQNTAWAGWTEANVALLAWAVKSYKRVLNNNVFTLLTKMYVSCPYEQRSIKIPELC